MDSARTSRRTFHAVVTLIAAASAATTIAWSAPARMMDGMSMAVDSMASTPWSWATGTRSFAAAASFLGMWVSMTPAMMLPSVAPSLWGYRVTVRRSGAMHPDRLTAVAALGYLSVWAMAGVGVLSIGVELARVERVFPLPAPLARLAPGLAVVAMGVIQCSAWKARQLGRCRCHAALVPPARPAERHAWRHGVRLGIDCLRCCANLMALLLVAGVMDPGAMAAATGAITLERLAPRGAQIARATGTVAVGAGVLLLIRALSRA
jgi:predicted metal-binding membrane protein